MSPKKTPMQFVPRMPPGGKRDTSAKQDASLKEGHAKPQLVSGGWLLAAVCITVAIAAACGWLVLCLLFWQGSWELLYHPSRTVQKTPASAGLTFDPVAFAVTDAGAPQLKGWWVPAAQGAGPRRLTVVYLHGQDGNIGNTVDALVLLHEAGVNVFAFDYRGYGESQFARPSERNWRQDVEWALDYLTETRQIDTRTIVVDGAGLGANLALEVAAAHLELAGVVVESPTAEPLNSILNDGRARLVPAHLLVRDRYNLVDAARAVRVPVLWLEPPMHDEESSAYAQVAAHKMFVSVDPDGNVYKQTEDALSRWLDELPTR
jgi:uncharacterized protein